MELSKAASLAVDSVIDNAFDTINEKCLQDCTPQQWCNSSQGGAIEVYEQAGGKKFKKEWPEMERQIIDVLKHSFADYYEKNPNKLAKI